MATTAQDNVEIIRRFFDAWNDADFEVVDELVAPDAEGHNPIEPSVPPGPDGEKQLIELYHSAFADVRIDLDDVFATDDKVAIRYTASGTHEGEFMGIEPTGTDVEVVGFDISRIDNGQIVESWGLFDAFGLMQQLGAVDPPTE